VAGGLLAGDAAAYRYLNDSIARFLSVAEADELLQTVQAQIAARGGRVRLGASTGALAHLLPQALEALLLLLLLVLGLVV
jgi:hypothetical protein